MTWQAMAWTRPPPLPAGPAPRARLAPLALRPVSSFRPERWNLRVHGATANGLLRGIGQHTAIEYGTPGADAGQVALPDAAGDDRALRVQDPLAGDGEPVP